jgi:hypothetical protein
MRVHAVGRQSEQAAVERGEPIGVAGKTDRLAGARRGEIGRMGEEHQPRPGEIAQTHDPMRRAALEIRGRLIEPRFGL